MKEILIDQTIKEACPQAVLGCIQCRIRVREGSLQLQKEMEQTCSEILERYKSNSDIAKRDAIFHTRSAYKALGKEPGRYRGSSEAMHRRIVNGKGLYRINNIVDAMNLLSIYTGNSLGVYDAKKIQNKVCWRRARQGECYRGIGKDAINIEYLPVLSDEKGAFGNPTGDSERAMITSETKEIFLCIYSFEGDKGLKEKLLEAQSLIEKYCEGEEFEQEIIYG